MKSKICKSRKNTNSIMNHRGYGGILLHREGVDMFIPQRCITSKGKIKKYALLEFEKKVEQYKKNNEYKNVI